MTSSASSTSSSSGRESSTQSSCEVLRRQPAYGDCLLLWRWSLLASSGLSVGLLKSRSPTTAPCNSETTGLANPAPVIQTFFVDDNIKDACVLDAVLTVVDAKHVTQHLDDQKPEGVVNEAVQQIAFADKVLLNKTDLVGGEELSALKHRIKHMNKTVEIIECVRSQVSLSSTPLCPGQPC